MQSRRCSRSTTSSGHIVREMFELMYASKGIGLAANQVGIPLRFFILNLTADPEQPDEEKVFINPEIVKRHSSEENEEGCLSFPGLYGKVRRARKIKVQAYDLLGNPIELDADELLGRAIQHETDHLDGKLFIDYLGPIAKTTTSTKIKEIEARYRKAQAEGIYPDDEEIRRQLDEVASERLSKQAQHFPGTLRVGSSLLLRVGPAFESQGGPRFIPSGRGFARSTLPYFEQLAIGDAGSTRLVTRSYQEGRPLMLPSPRIVMLGTKDFALPTFEHLCETGHGIVALVTQPDRPQGREATPDPQPDQGSRAGPRNSASSSRRTSTPRRRSN